MLKDDLKEVAPNENFDWLLDLISRIEVELNKPDANKEQLEQALKVTKEEIPMLIKARHASNISQSNIDKIVTIIQTGLNLGMILAK
jgi:adenine/guanine phosphoribosyltransferase-like PRPP-binding protein